MINKFINDELTEEEIDSMMLDFIEKKQQLEFKEKWGKIIKEYMEPEEKGLLLFFRKHIYATVSAASLFILLSIVGVYYGYNFSKTPIVYSSSSKGIDKTYIKLTKLIEKQQFSINESYSERENLIINYYNKGKYSVLIKEIEGMPLNNISDRMLFIAGISAIRKRDYKMANSYFYRINEKSEYSVKTKTIIELLQGINH